MRIRELVLFMVVIGIGVIGNGQSLPIKVARTIAFTTDEGSYMDVDVSPDGKMLLFDLLGDLYILPSTGGKARQLTRGIALNLRPVWSPDGKKIAYSSDATGSTLVHVIDTAHTLHTVVGRDLSDLRYETEVLWATDCNSLIVHHNEEDLIYGLAGGKAP